MYIHVFIRLLLKALWKNYLFSIQISKVHVKIYCIAKFHNLEISATKMTVVLIKCKVWNENFYTGKVYIFEKYSLTAFKWYITWGQKWAVSKNTKCIRISRNLFDWQYLHNYKCYNSEKIFFGSTLKEESISICC